MLQWHQPKGSSEGGLLLYDKHLDSFLMVADLGSFSKAAEKLYISPNAIIKQINLLENDLGITLFIRTNQGVKLTEAGKSIYQDAKRIIRISRQAIETAKNIEKIEVQSIRIGTSLLRPCKTIIDRWVPLSEKYPNIKLQISPFEDSRSTWYKILDNLGKDIDVVASIYPSTLWGNRCQVLELTKLPLCCAVARTHPLAKKAILNFEDLYGQTLIMVERGDTSYIDLLRNEIEQNHPQICIHDVPSYDLTVFNQCEIMNGLLITISTWAELHPSLVTIPCSWDFSVPYGIVYSLQPSKGVEKYIEAMKTLL